MYPSRYGTKVAASSLPSYGGDGGRKFCVVNVQSAPRRLSRYSVPSGRGGNCNLPSTCDAISAGSSDGHVNSRSATGTWVSACWVMTFSDRAARSWRSAVHAAGSRAREHDGAGLIGGGDLEQRLVALVRRHGHDSRQRVTGPHLRGEPDTEAGQRLLTHPVGDGPGGHAHRQHAVREHAGVDAHLAGEPLVGVQRVVVTRGTRVLDDAGAGEVLDEDRGAGRAHLKIGRSGHSAA